MLEQALRGLGRVSNEDKTGIRTFVSASWLGQAFRTATVSGNLNLPTNSLKEHPGQQAVTSVEGPGTLRNDINVAKNA